MNQFIIDLLGQLLVIAMYVACWALFSLGVALTMPVVFHVVFAIEQRHDRKLELLDKQIELERAKHATDQGAVVCEGLCRPDPNGLALGGGDPPVAEPDCQLPDSGNDVGVDHMVHRTKNET